MTDEVRTGRRRLRFSLRVSVIVVMLGTVGLTTAAVHIPWLFVSSKNVAEVVQQVNAEIVSGVDREVTAIFESAIAAQTTLHNALADRVIDIEDREKRERLFLAILDANPEFSWVSFGKPNGDFFGAQRRDSMNLRLAESRWNPVLRHADRVETSFIDTGREINETVTKREVNDYYAPDRAWYEKALASPGENVWTDIYVFNVSRRPGLNSAITLTRKETGALVGVISIAIELNSISNYLAGLTSVRSGTAFIADREGKLIAFPDAAELMRQRTDGEMELKPMSASGNALLKVVSTAVALNKIDLARVGAPMQVTTKGSDGERYFLSLAPSVRGDWLVGTLIPEADFMTTIRENYTRLGITVTGALALVCILALLVTRWFLVTPLRRLMKQTDKIARFDLDAVRPVESPLIEISALSDSIGRMSSGLGSFRRYMPTDLVRSLLRSGMIAEIGGERRTMTVMFMDLEGFTSISERLGHRVVPLLADYFRSMSGAILGRKGTIDKFIGDGVMAFWGAPNHDEEHPLRACQAALDCQAAMARLREDWTGRNLPAPRLRIGLTTGRVVVGNIGSEERLNYTVIGDPVNLASRLEGLNREYGTGILISQQCWELVKYDTLARRIDTVRAKGKDEPVLVYELLAVRDEAGEVEGFDWVKGYETALTHYLEGRLTEAESAFERAIEARGGDRASAVYIERIRARTGVPDPARAAKPSAASHVRAISSGPAGESRD